MHGAWFVWVAAFWQSATSRQEGGAGTGLPSYRACEEGWEVHPYRRRRCWGACSAVADAPLPLFTPRCRLTTWPRMRARRTWRCGWQGRLRRWGARGVEGPGGGRGMGTGACGDGPYAVLSRGPALPIPVHDSGDSMLAHARRIPDSLSRPPQFASSPTYAPWGGGAPSACLLTQLCWCTPQCALPPTYAACLVCCPSCRAGPSPCAWPRRP